MTRVGGKEGIVGLSGIKEGSRKAWEEVRETRTGP